MCTVHSVLFLFWQTVTHEFYISVFRLIPVHYVGMSCQQMTLTMKNIENKRFALWTIDSDSDMFLVELVKQLADFL